MSTSVSKLRTLLVVGFVVALAFSCMKGRGFMTQGPSEEEKKTAAESGEVKKIVVETIDAGAGAVTGNLTASSVDVQVVQANSDSAIAGSQVEFPPGSLTIDTQITLGPGVSIATSSNLGQLALDPDFAAVAPSVSISSSVAIDTTSGFTMQIPVPSQSGLHLQDALANLIVLYKVKKVAENGEFTGLFTRRQLELVDGYVRFSTTFFGTYQAIITKKLVEEAKEIAVKPEPKTRKFYYTQGFPTSMFADDVPRSDGLVALFQAFTPAMVKADTDSKLTTGLLIKRTQEVTEP